MKAVKPERALCEFLQMPVLLFWLALFMPARSLAGEPATFTNSLGMHFVTVPGISNVMFCIWLTRVEDFRAFVADATNNRGYDYRNGCQPCIFTSNEWSRAGWNYGWANPSFEQRADHPVVCVNWLDAEAFCRWLTKREQVAGIISSKQRYRLPTDGEWSIAAGLPPETGNEPADKSMKIKDVYSWGTNWPPPPKAGNFGGEECLNGNWPSYLQVITNYNDGYPRTSPVDAFPSNQYGLYDMNGNAGEWCADAYHAQSPQLRVWRGGTWNCVWPGNLWLSTREFDHLVESRYSSIGFRIVLAPVSKDSSDKPSS